MAWQETFGRVERTFRESLTGRLSDPKPNQFCKLAQMLDRGIADINDISVGETVPMPYGMKAAVTLKVFGEENVATAVAFFPATAGGMEINEKKVTFNLRDHPDHSLEIYMPIGSIDISSGERRDPQSLLEVVALNEESSIPFEVVKLDKEFISPTHWVVREKVYDVGNSLEKNHTLEHKRQYHFVFNPHRQVSIGVFFAQPYGVKPSHLIKILMWHDISLYFKRD